jgi:copper transport protein
VRRASVVGAALAAALALPAAAAAHATITQASPVTQSDVKRPPTQVTIHLSEAVTITPNAIEVFATDGKVLSGVARLSPDGHTVSTRVSGLQRGSAYTVRWRVTGQDGHSPAGVYTFGVGVKAPPPFEAVGASGTTWKDDVARWGLFAALALVIGPLVFRLVVLRGAVPPPLEHRFHLVTSVATFGAINVGIAAFVLRAANALQLPIGDLVYGDLQPFADKTRAGEAFLVMTVGLGTVAALLLLAWVFDRLDLRWPALLLAVVLVSGLSLSGHQATEPNATWASELADWLHLAAACVWVGGVVTLAFLVWPLAPELRRKAFIGFSRIAVGLVGVLVLAGAYLALVRLPELSDLWTTRYGQLLIVKSVLVFVALSWGSFHHTFVRPRLEAGEQPRVRPSLIAECTVALLVLLAAAVLTNGAPPAVKPSSGLVAKLSAQR